MIKHHAVDAGNVVRLHPKKRRLTDAIVKALPAPATGNKVTFDADVKGFGVRVTTAGARAFVLQYRTHTGRERRYTIGGFPDWQTTAARQEAKRLKGEVRVNGADPLADLQSARGEPTVGDMIDRYIEEHLPKKRPASQAEDRGLIKQWLAGPLRHAKVADVDFEDVDSLHRKVTKSGTPYRANRVVALLSKMFALAIRWRWRTDNPCIGIERNQEAKRTRYLTTEEVDRLNAALATYEDQEAANAIRLLLFTGARRGETLAAKWDDFDLEAGVWIKPGATTKQRTEHRVPLSAPARQLLAGMKRSSEYLFPGKDGKGHRVDLKRPWPAICNAASLKNFRLHDLRHSSASVLASSGQSLPIIGALLGHTQAATTMRYAHLLDDALRAATESAGTTIMGKTTVRSVQ
jgi:integrase